MRAIRHHYFCKRYENVLILGEGYLNGCYDHRRCEKCGYSKATVSRAFASPEAVSERAKARIYAAANELNYTPNPIARAMARPENG